MRRGFGRVVALVVPLALAAGCMTDGLSRVRFPILNAKGKYTVRVAFCNPQDGQPALYYANQLVTRLRNMGNEAYVTDLKTKAIVSIGSFRDADDPALIETWRTAYASWQKELGRSTAGEFSRAMQQWHGGNIPLGGSPWPVSILQLQMDMKSAYKILTDEDKRRYREELIREKEAAEKRRRANPETNPDRN